MIVAGSAFLLGEYCVCQIVDRSLSNAALIGPSLFSLSDVTVNPDGSIGEDAPSDIVEERFTLSMMAYTAFVSEPILVSGRESVEPVIPVFFTSPSYVKLPVALYSFPSAIRTVLPFFVRIFNVIF